MNKFQLDANNTTYGDYVILDADEAMPSEGMLKKLITSALLIGGSLKITHVEDVKIVLKDFTNPPALVSLDICHFPDELAGKRTAGFKAYIKPRIEANKNGSEVQEETRHR